LRTVRADGWIRPPEYWLVLLAVGLISVFYYGIRAAAVLGLAAVTAVLTDFICLFLQGRPYRTADLSKIGTALVLVLMFPATIPYSIVILSTVFAVAVGTHIFGSRQDTLFPPAAVGYLFALLCWKDEVLSFPETGQHLSLFGNDVTLHTSLSAAFNSEGVLHTQLLDLMLGAVYGPMGTGCLLLLIIGLVVLMMRGGVNSWVCLGYLFGNCLAAFWFGFAPLQMLSVNMLLFSTLFLAGDPLSVPCDGVFACMGGTFMAIFTQYLISTYKIEYAAIIVVVLFCPVWYGLECLERRCDAWSAARKKAAICTLEETESVQAEGDSEDRGETIPAEASVDEKAEGEETADETA
jgi:electron transport complex protein RnfD